MATCSNTQKDPIESLINYINTIKPYHTKIAETSLEYVHTEAVAITISERFQTTLTLFETGSSEAGCDNDGYGIVPFGSLQGIPICDIDLLTETITLSGDHSCLFKDGLCLYLEVITNPPIIINYHKVVYNGGSTVFTMPFNILTATPGRINADCFINGVKQKITTDFTITLPSQITVSELLISGDIIEFYIYGTSNATVGPIYHTTNVIADGINQSFILPFVIDPVVAGKTRLFAFINGVKTFFNITGVSTIQFPSLLLTGDVIEVYGNYGTCGVDLIQPEYYTTIASGSSTITTPFIIQPPLMSGLTVVSQSVEVFVNGIKKIYGDEYTTTTVQITINGLQIGDTIEVHNHSNNCDSITNVIYNTLCCNITSVVVDPSNAITACDFGQPKTIIQLSCNIDETLLPDFPLLTNQLLGGFVYPDDIPIFSVIPYNINENNNSNVGSNMFVVNGDYVCRFCQGHKFVVSGANAGIYTVVYSDFVSGQTKIRVHEHIPFTGLVPGDISWYSKGYSEHTIICCEGQKDHTVIPSFREILTFSTNVANWFQSQIVNFVSNNTFIVLGDLSVVLSPTTTFEIISNNTNAGSYTVFTSVYNPSLNITTIQTTTSPFTYIRRYGEFTVFEVNIGTNTITVNGDATTVFSLVHNRLRLFSDDINTGKYTLSSISYNGTLDRTVITVIEPLGMNINYANNYVIQPIDELGTVQPLGWV